MPKIIITEDGSHSLKLPGLDEHYHSVHGAIAESMHVFIRAGLEKMLESSPGNINILEVGFGTGLNALLTLAAIHKETVVVKYTALEPFPLPADTWQALNYPELIMADKTEPWFRDLHDAPWGEMHEITAGFYLQKLREGIVDLDVDVPTFNLVYFDAFGPDVQPELWTDEMFKLLAQVTVKDGILVTYSAKGSVRRAMQSAGFSVERLPGPKGKREMLRATRFY